MASTIQITLIKSRTGRPPHHTKVLQGMGLTKINKRIELQDTPANRGMVEKVAHLVRVEVKTDENK